MNDPRLTPAATQPVLAALRSWGWLADDTLPASMEHMNLVFVCYYDADYLHAHTRQVDYTKCVGLGVASSYLDESFTRQELLLGCVPWKGIDEGSTNTCSSTVPLTLATVAWDMSRWTAFQWALFIKGLVGQSPISDVPLTSILVAYKMSRGRADFAGQIQRDLVSLSPQHADVLFTPDAASFRDVGLLFDVQVSKELAQFGIHVSDRTDTPAMTFLVGHFDEIIFDCDAKMYHTVHEYIATRVASAEVKRKDVLSAEAVAELQTAAVTIAEDILQSMRAPEVNYLWEVQPNKWKADATERIEAVRDDVCRVV
ncbi:hypothetical protein DYB36_012226 [Aphanomyces astaci]|uniref:Uncharacterized protein n=1 Tax=Aphanomyces astaci TaxID=112090 RepID=A0A397BEB2_APHAT|nr:hypothetical protein DYB36_012226 [Aphanomyces astaci]